MKRTDIRGWTWKLGRFGCEFVTVRHILNCIAIYNGQKLIRRWEV